MAVSYPFVAYVNHCDHTTEVLTVGAALCRPGQVDPHTSGVHAHSVRGACCPCGRREAISFALIEQEAGQSRRARSVADSIEAGHTAELTTLQSLLNTTAR
jgi:hypothetical protein